jgi:hypothetical protein
LAAAVAGVPTAPTAAALAQLLGDAQHLLRPHPWQCGQQAVHVVVPRLQQVLCFVLCQFYGVVLGPVGELLLQAGVLCWQVLLHLLQGQAWPADMAQHMTHSHMGSVRHGRHIHMVGMLVSRPDIRATVPVW